ncbi:MAG: L-threonylcarbamoyladenylate synthase [Eubacteriales bacterium]|nr:L-threonylcarbamoyladenylate synthase [Eubacteriales bacterium]
MKTRVLKVDPSNIDADSIREAAEVIKAGGLVAFPTETVYGLGASALDEKAIRKIFTAKGRPQDNPLILHVAAVSQAAEAVEFFPPNAKILIDKFWPGPLTLVMKKSSKVPSVVTGGLDTVAVRMPSDPVALELIRCSNVAIVAPSANISGHPSTTNAQHVIDDLSGKIDLILDSGPCRVGVESTVLDLTISPPAVLRPGGTTLESLRQVLGNVVYSPFLTERPSQPRSPGMKYAHYLPKADMYIVRGNIGDVVKKIRALASEYKKRGISVGVLATDQTASEYEGFAVLSAGNRDRPESIAECFFGILRRFDKMNVSIILSEAIDAEGVGMAVMNRMEKAAAYKFIDA